MTENPADSKPTHCWVAEQGEYEQREVIGVFASAELAMGHYGGEWTRTFWASGWEPNLGPVNRYWQEWDNGDVTVTPWKVVDSGPVAEVSQTVIQSLDETRGWDYLEATPETLAAAEAMLDD